MSNNIEQKLSLISRETLDRYSRRYKNLGYNIRTIGWGSQEQQKYRFTQTLMDVSLEKKDILDLGCGFGDYYDFIKENQIMVKSYQGWDLNFDLLTEAGKRHQDEEKVIFNEKDLTKLPNDVKEVADVGIMLGLLNFNLKNKVDNYEYSKLMIKKALSVVKEVLIVDFISTYRTYDYPKEDFIFYHDPAVMLNFALSLEKNVILKHNYHPIPQKEFMLVIFKEVENI